VKQGNNPYCFFTINLKPEKATEEYLEEFSEVFKKFIENRALIKGRYIYSLDMDIYMYITCSIKQESWAIAGGYYMDII
jgi:hypothetical protein